MKRNILIGMFRSKDTAALAMEELSGQGYCIVNMYQLKDAPVEGVNPMKNPYAGELPLFARGVPGSDVAVEGRSSANLYSREDAEKIMGHDRGPDPAYALVIDVTDHRDKRYAEDILKKHGAVTSSQEIDAGN